MKKSLRRSIWLAAAILAVVALAHAIAQHMEYRKMHTMPPGLREFNVNDPVPSCGRWKDTMPKTREPTAYRLYIQARNFWRSRVEWQFSRQELEGIFRDVQTAAARGDWGARALLAHFYLTGLGPLDTNHMLESNPDKAVEIVRTAVAAGQAWGFYDLGVAYEHGYGGAWQDHKIAWAYYLRAAELGSPDAQMALASAYAKAKRDDAEEAMLSCAYRQGHGPAAYELGVTAKVLKRYSAALQFYQNGVKFGSARCAIALRIIFDKRKWIGRDKASQDALRLLAVLPDDERRDRYSQIADALELNPDLRLSRLDSVLALPPAELPKWHGIANAIDEPTQPTY